MPYAVNSIIEVVCKYRVNDQDCLNVLHYGPAGDSTGFSITTLVDAFADLYGGIGNGTFAFEFGRVMSSNVTYVETTFQHIFPTRWVKHSRPVTYGGQRMGETTAQNVAATVTKTGTMAGRNKRGSIHIGGLAETEYAGGLLGGPYKVVLQQLVDFLASELPTTLPTPLTYIPVLLNKTLIPGSDPKRYQISGYSDLRDWTIRQQLRTQRSRTAGVGI